MSSNISSVSVLVSLLDFLQLIHKHRSAYGGLKETQIHWFVPHSNLLQLHVTNSNIAFSVDLHPFQWVPILLLSLSQQWSVGSNNSFWRLKAIFQWQNLKMQIQPIFCWWKNKQTNKKAVVGAFFDSENNTYLSLLTLTPSLFCREVKPFFSMLSLRREITFMI